MNRNQFAALFKRFRLLAGFASLRQFADALAESGLILDESSLSHWQKGRRIPKDRQTFLVLLKTLIDNGGILTQHDANLFLESAGYGALTDSEITKYCAKLVSNLSVEDKLKQVSLTRELTGYYLDFLKQGQPGGTHYYSEIDIEYDRIIKVINDCLLLKIYTPGIDMWMELYRYVWHRGRWPEVQHYADKFMKIAEMTGAVEQWFSIGGEQLAWLYHWQGEYDKAREIINQIEFQLNRLNNIDLEMRLKQKAAVTLMKFDQTEKASDYLATSQVYFEKHDSPLLAKNYLYQGHLAKKDNNPDNALVNYERSLKVAQKHFHPEQAKSNFYLGELLRGVHPDRARHHYQEALEWEKKSDRQAGLAWNLYGLAQVGEKNSREVAAKEAWQIFSDLKMAEAANKVKQIL